MKVVTALEMKDIDRRTIGYFGIPGAVLMERAGVSVANRVRELYGSPARVTVICGTGNNGGDGLVAARELHNRGLNVRGLVAGPREKLSPDCKAQIGAARKTGVRVEFRSTLTKADLHGAVVIDALFGTGLKKDITGPMARAVEALNRSGAPVVSVDIPSGVSADNGQVLGAAVEASATVTFGAPKRGHLLYPGAGHSGRLFVEDIGFPRALFEPLKCSLLEKQEVALLVPERPLYSHKGDYGHVLIVAGSRGKTGAALMAARACLRAGAGLVTIGAPETIAAALQGAVTEEMLLFLPDAGDGSLSSTAMSPLLEFVEERADVLALGPGIGRSAQTARLVPELLLRTAAPMVVDADAIIALEGRAAALKKTKAPVILTPHPGEFARVSGQDVSRIEGDRVESALSFSRKYETIVVLKGAPTVIAEPGGEAFINSTGNPGMAKAGTGDVLTGVLAALLGQGLSPIDACLLGVYVHGLAGDLAADEYGPHSVVASDIIGALPEAFTELGAEKA